MPSPSVDDPASKNSDLAISSADDAQKMPAPGNKSDAPVDLHTVLNGSSKEERNQFEEEERVRRTKALGRRVAKRIADPNVRSLQGRALRPIDEAVEKFWDDFEYVYRLAETFSTATLSPPVAAQEFLDLVEDRAAADWPPIRLATPSGSQPFSEPELDDEPPMSENTRQKMAESIRGLRERLG